MEKRIASFWIGKVRSIAAVRAILEYSVSEDGDFEGCRFSRELCIGDYEPEFVEWKVFPKMLTDFRLMFREFSYSENFLGVLVGMSRKISGNCVVGFYGVEFPGRPSEKEIDGNQFEFLSCLEY